MNSFDYIGTATPENYRCHDCHRTGIRLWREYKTPDPRILCARCAERSQRRHHIRKDGFWKGIFWKSQFRLREGDQIGWYTPAIPMPDSNQYYGYPGIPNTHYRWWQRLPVK